MKIGLRLLLGYFLIVAIAAWFVLTIFLQEVKPGVRRAMEGTLVDTATLLAAIARDDLLRGQVQQGQLARAFSQLNQYPVGANISGISKDRNAYRIYLTDVRGKVLLDSTGQAVGQDYSQWNDVWLTLRGKYGARSTRTDPDDDGSTVMYVAAPVRDGDHIIGVLTVGKANKTMQPVIARSERRILWAGAALLGIALLIGLGFVLWINRTIGKLVRYADSVTAGKATPLPQVSSSELRKLARALESMRLRLEGKSYIEHYVNALTHELKSPLAAIRGAAEILRESPPAEVSARFCDNILQQNARMQLLIDNLLTQAKLESKIEIAVQTVDLMAVLTALCESRAVRIAQQKVAVTILSPPGQKKEVNGDPLLLEQAIANLLDNALDFTPAGGKIELALRAHSQHITVRVSDSGSGIPDFALPRIFERFYSLPRESGQKSSGLGLAFVQEVARLHGGGITLCNRAEGGAEASLRLPLN